MKNRLRAVVLFTLHTLKQRKQDQYTYINYHFAFSVPRISFSL